MVSEVARYVRRYATSTKAKREQRKPAGCMGEHSTIDKSWDVLNVDIVGPLPGTKRGFSYIAVVSDCFNELVSTCAMRKASTKKIIEFLENNVFLVFWYPSKNYKRQWCLATRILSFLRELSD